MDPTAAIPLHFTLQAVGIASAGLVLAWGVVRGRVLAATGAGLLGIAEGLHAGRYLGSDDEPALVLLRLGGVALVGSVALGSPTARRWLAAAALALAAGTLWGAGRDGGIADPSWGPHLLLAAGYVVVAVWTWTASRDSVRLRVLTGLVAMLAITVVVGGAAVSRVAALDKSNEQLRRLGAAATAVGGELSDGADDLARRAALLSPLVWGERSQEQIRDEALAAVGPAVDEAVVLVREGRTTAFVVAPGADDPPVSEAEAGSVRSLGAAERGRTGRTITVVAGRVLLAGAAPVLRPGSEGARADGAVAILRWVGPASLRASARLYAPGAEVVAADRSAASSDADLIGIEPPDPEGGVAFARVAAPDRTRPAATTAVGDGTRLVVVGSDEGVVAAATGLLRALLIAILAAALLAVVVALWLSDRVTRPILDLAAGAERVKADFLSNVSHELRTPLTPIRGYTEILRRGRVPARRASDYLDEIGDAAERLERIVALLLDVASLEAGRFAIAAEDLRPAELLGAAAARAGERTAGREISVSAPRSLPRVRADADAIARVLDELVDNALKFSPDGRPVSLRARRTDTGVEFAVSDEGGGVTPDQIRDWSIAFAQAETGDRRRYGGLGLGLTYVAGVLAAHQAGLTVSAEPGGGTTFAFTLPAASMVSPMPGEASQAPARPTRPRRTT